MSTDTATATSRFTPTAIRDRVPGPDVSRGLVLLGIAIANLTTLWLLIGGGPAGVFGPRPHGPVDVVFGVLEAMFVHQRGLPMFSALLAYGVGLLLAREARRGTPFLRARGLLLRRYLMLSVIGAAHMIFLFQGDILVAYGLIAALIALVFLRSSTKLLLRLAIGVYIFLVVAVLVGLIVELWLRAAAPEAIAGINDFVTGPQLLDNLKQSSYPGAMLSGVITLFGTVLGGFGFQFLTFAPVMLIGFVAGRQMLLNDPDAHLGLLRKIGYGGLAVSVLGGLVVGLMSMGVLGEQPWLWSPMGLSLITGMPGGLATIALITLACRRWQTRPGEEPRPLPLPVEMLRALGQRSLSGYLFQSVAFVILLPSFTLGLAAKLTITTGTLLAVGVWLVSLVGAWLMSRTGYRGPAETLHKRLVYGVPDDRPSVGNPPPSGRP